jgi:hypothetical protein
LFYKPKEAVLSRRVNKFYAVTLTSIYRVTWKKGYRPEAKKIELYRESYRSVGTNLDEGEFLGISPIQLVTYNNINNRDDGPNPRVPPESVAKMDWRCWTSTLIALFLRKREAQKCARKKSWTNLDRRWIKQTRETARAIGPNHPVFVFSESWKLK